MSTDVRYYSFSPSRADKQWAHFVEDISILRKKYAPFQLYENERQNIQKKQAEIEAYFELKIKEIRTKIFQFFEKKGYVIPGVEWWDTSSMTDEDKIQYLEDYGAVYPRDADLSSRKDVPYLMLSVDAPELKDSYIRIRNERNQAIEQLQKQFVLKEIDTTIILNQRQEELDNNIQL